MDRHSPVALRHQLNAGGTRRFVVRSSAQLFFYMANSLLNKKVLYEFENIFAGWTLREISAEFDVADLQPDTAFIPAIAGQRRTLVQQYYHRLDLSNPKDVAKLLNVFENVLTQLRQLENGYHADEVKATAARNFTNLTQWLGKDGFEFRDGKLIATRKAPTLPGIKGVAVLIDSAYLEQQIHRMETAVEDDPWLAIGTAKELVETTCKTILSERRQVRHDGIVQERQKAAPART
jgi:hypothetical protein